MQQALKQRLVGALVILALVVIFLPMLLEGPVERTRVDVPIQVPPEPEAVTDETLPEPDFVDQPSPGSAGEDRPAGDATPTAEPVADDSDDTAGSSSVADGGSPRETSTASDDDAVAETSAEVAPGDDAEAQRSDKTASSEAGDSANGGSGSPEGRPTSWVVQVGAFRDASNAERLRERLTEAGFEDAFRDRSRRDGDVFHRVRLGPQSERSQAESVLERLKSSLDLDGILVPR